jgi:CelD/BcsL family acetyltransferase involved in cellulose biosynthesis
VGSTAFPRLVPTDASVRFAAVTAASPEPRGHVVSVARTVDEVEALRPVWSTLRSSSLQGDIDYFLTIERHHPRSVRPHVVELRSPTGEPSLLATHVFHRPLNHRLGPWAPYRPRLRSLTYFRGLVGEPTESELVPALESLRGELSRGVDAILLNNLGRSSPLYAAAVEVFPLWTRQRWAPERLRWDTRVGSAAEDVHAVRSRSTRDNIRRTQRRIEREFGERATMRVLSKPEDAARVFDDIDAVAVKTYQTGSLPIFALSELDRSLATLGLEKGWFRAYMLYIEDEPVAFWTGFSYGGVFGWRGVTGYDPAYRRYGVGRFLLVSLLEDLARDPDVEWFSLGPGTLPYKRSFADEQTDELDVRIFSKRPRGLVVNGVGSAVHGAHAFLRATRDIRYIGRHAHEFNERRKRKERLGQ